MLQQKVVSFHYKLTDTQGQEIDASDPGHPLTFLSGAQQIIPGLEKELIVMLIGTKKRVEVPASEAYGTRDDSLMHSVPREALPEGDIKVGDVFRTDDSSMQVVTVRQITDKAVVLDGNHPLAGVDLVFDVELVSAREATAEEIAHGHVHGEGGHHH